MFRCVAAMPIQLLVISQFIVSSSHIKANIITFCLELFDQFFTSIKYSNEEQVDIYL